VSHAYKTTVSLLILIINTTYKFLSSNSLWHAFATLVSNTKSVSQNKGENVMTVDEKKNASDALVELIEHHENLKRFEPKKMISQGGNCPRCNSGRMTSSGFDYCPDCNWDSVEDYSSVGTR
jgi:hypothetical protein